MRRPALPRRPAFATVALALFLLLAGANIPTPLYDVYRREFGFSAFEMTAIFATYPFTLVVALWTFARISDRFGRRPVLIASLFTAAAGSGLFAAASGPAWLFAARCAQGLALGLLSGAGSAALVELEPRGDTRRASLTATAAFAAGTAIGPLLGGILAQYAPLPTRLSYLLHLAVMIPLTLLAFFLPETVPASSRNARWLPRIPALPPSIRAQFTVASIAGGLAWAIVALFISVVPSYLRVELGVRNLALAGLVAFVVLAASTGAQFALRGLRDRTLLVWSLILGATGVAAVVLAVPLHAVALVGAGALLCGIAHASGILGGLSIVNRIAPEDVRGETLSLHYAVMYFIVGVLVLTVGVLANAYGFFLAFAAFWAAFAILAAALGVAVANSER